MDGVPDLAEVRDWIKVPVAQLSDEQLQQVIDSELTIQARINEVPEEAPGAVYPPPLAQALLRRCARQVAAKAVPLGMVGADATEYGPVSLPGWDAEIARLEASYRLAVVS